MDNTNNFMTPGFSPNPQPPTEPTPPIYTQPTSISEPQPFPQPIIAPEPTVTPDITTPSYQSSFQSQPLISTSDDDLLRAFIGKNYEKITTQKFNVPAFFLNFIYFLYRKMAGWGILVGLIAGIIASIISNLISSFFSSSITYFIVSYALSFLVTGLVSAFTANKLYLKRAHKKINKIKEKHPNADYNTLLTLCTKKGGTSLALAIIVPLALIIIFIGIFFLIMTLTVGLLFSVQEILSNPNNIWNFIINGSPANSTTTHINSTSPTTPTNPNSPSSGETFLLENVHFNGYSCLNNLCNLMITTDTGVDYYQYNATEYPMLKLLYNYSDSLTINIYYTQTNDEKLITDYDVYLTSTGEDLKSITTEDELFEKLGLYNLGTHTDTFTYIEYDWPDFIFANQKGVKIKMGYYEEEADNLIEGTEYLITFDVEEGILDYDYKIISITKN